MKLVICNQIGIIRIFFINFSEYVLNPTAENIAKYFFDEIALLITNKDVKVKEVTIWETPRSAVTYSE